MYHLAILVCITLMSSPTHSVTNTSQTQIRAVPSSWTAVPGEVMQFAIIAEFADGTEKDVTEECSFSAQDGKVVAEVTEQDEVNVNARTVVNGWAIATGPGSSKLDVSWFPSNISHYSGLTTIPRSAGIVIPVTVLAKNIASILLTPDPWTTAEVGDVSPAFKAIGILSDGTKTDASADCLWTVPSFLKALPGNRFEAIKPGNGELCIRSKQDPQVSSCYRMAITDSAAIKASIGISANPNQSRYQIGDTVTFTEDVQNKNPKNTYTYLWYVDGTMVKKGRDCTHTFTEPGRHYVQLEIKSSDPKENDAITKNISVEYPPDVEVQIRFNPETNLYKIGSTVGFVAEIENPSGKTEYRWYVSGEYIGSGKTGVSHKFKEAGEFEIKLGLRMGSNFDEIKETRALTIGDAKIGVLGRERNRFAAQGAPADLRILSSYWRGGDGTWSEPSRFNSGTIGAVDKHILFSGDQADGYNTGYLVYAPKNIKVLKFNVFHFSWGETAQQMPHGISHYSGQLPMYSKVPVTDSINFTRKSSRMADVEWRTVDGSSCRVRINKFSTSNTIRYSGVDELGCEAGVYPPVKEEPDIEKPQKKDPDVKKKKKKDSDIEKPQVNDPDVKDPDVKDPGTTGKVSQNDVTDSKVIDQDIGSTGSVTGSGPNIGTGGSTTGSGTGSSTGGGVISGVGGGVTGTGTGSVGGLGIGATSVNKVSSLSCKNNDNEENGCCCFRGAHTYLFGLQSVGSVRAEFDTGRGQSCRSKVKISVQRENDNWDILKTIDALSGKDGKDLAPTTAAVGVNGMIKGVRIDDGCACCLDDSKIELSDGGMSSQNGTSLGSGLKIDWATYGANCGTSKGNVTTHIANQCNGKSECKYTVDHRIIGDPAGGCAKGYAVHYTCNGNPQGFEKAINAEAGWGDKSVFLQCGGSKASSNCGLGNKWDAHELGWTGVLTRRGASNVFDAVWTSGSRQEKATLTININGNTVNINRQQTDKGSSFIGQGCKYKGTLAADNVTVTGTYGCDWAAGPFSWRATIRCGGSAITPGQVAGLWRDLEGNNLLLEQNGNDLTATALENKGPIGWLTKTTKGKLNDGSMSFRWWNRDFFGKISDDNNQIVWDVIGTDSIWTRFNASPSAADIEAHSWQKKKMSGVWTDLEGNHMQLVQNGNELTATALENKGPIGWLTKTTKGKLNYGTMSFRWWNRNFFGKISDDNNRIVWDVIGTDSIWTRISANDGAKKAIPTTTSPIQLSGRWSISQNNGFSGEMTLHQDSSGKLTGDVGWNGNLFGSIKGSVSGNVVSFTISYPGKIKGHYKGTITEGGTRLINGTSKASTGDTATWSAKLSPKQEIKKVITGYGKKK